MSKHLTHEDYLEALARQYVNRAVWLYRKAAESARGDRRDALMLEAARLEGFSVNVGLDDAALARAEGEETPT